jgi:hypothetical protein
VVRGASPESYGLSFEMQRMGGTGIPALSRGEMDATIPVSGGVMSLHAEKPLSPSRLQRFMMGGPVQEKPATMATAAPATKQDPRTTALDARILKLAGLPPMDPSQYDQSVAKQVYRILGRANG